MITVLEISEEVRSILRVNGGLETDATQLASETDLFAAGMTSHANVNVLLALEDSFGIEFPEELVDRRTFRSVGTISEAVADLLADPV